MYTELYTLYCAVGCDDVLYCTVYITGKIFDWAAIEKFFWGPKNKRNLKKTKKIIDILYNIKIAKLFGIESIKLCTCCTSVVMVLIFFKSSKFFSSFT